MIKFIEQTKPWHKYTVLINNQNAGDLECKEDGYWDWWPEVPGRGGYIPAWVLREIADKLDDLNAPWDKIVQEHDS